MKQIPNTPNETHDSASIVPLSETIQEPALNSTSAALAYDFQDSKPPDAEFQPISDVGLSTNAPVQKPRPPDELHASSESTFVQGTKLPPPRPSPIVQTSTVRSHPINGYHAPDLQVLLPPTAQFFNESASDSSVVVNPGSVPIHSPSTQSSNIYPPVLTNDTSAVVQPSPVRKKIISFQEYMKKTKPEPLSASEKHKNGSPASSQNISKVVSLDREVKTLSAEGGIAVDASKKEDHDSLGVGKDTTM